MDHGSQKRTPDISGLGWEMPELHRAQGLLVFWVEVALGQLSLHWGCDTHLARSI